MAIKTSYSGEGTTRKAVINIDNGDLEALTRTLKQYGFVDEQALLRYALVALLSSEDHTLYIKSGDSVASLKVNDSLLKPNARNTEGDSNNGNNS